MTRLFGYFTEWPITKNTCPCSRCPDAQAVEMLFALMGTDSSRLIGAEAEQPAIVIRGEKFVVVVEDTRVGRWSARCCSGLWPT